MLSLVVSGDDSLIERKHNSAVLDCIVELLGEEWTYSPLTLLQLFINVKGQVMYTQLLERFILRVVVDEFV